MSSETKAICTQTEDIDSYSDSTSSGTMSDEEEITADDVRDAWSTTSGALVGLGRELASKHLSSAKEYAQDLLAICKMYQCVVNAQNAANINTNENIASIDNSC